MANRAVPIALNKKNMSNAERKAREKAEERLRTGTDKIKPPKWLTKEGKREFRRLAKLLMEIDLITNLDVDFLAVFANTLVAYQEVNEQIRMDGLTAIYTTKTGAENIVAHPLLTQRKQLADQIRLMGGELGLTPSSRAKLAMMPKEEKEEPTAFDQLFGNVTPLRRDAR